MRQLFNSAEKPLMVAAAVLMLGGPLLVDATVKSALSTPVPEMQFPGHPKVEGMPGFPPPGPAEFRQMPAVEVTPTSKLGMLTVRLSQRTAGHALAAPRPSVTPRSM